MFETVDAVAIALVVLLPGAAYTFAYERVAGAFGQGNSDRLLRFLTASAAFHALASAVTYHLYRTQIRQGRFAAGRTSWWLLEVIAVLYVGVPTLLGWLVGTGKSRQWRWARWIVGPAPEPRAWDYLWSRRPTGTIRLRTKSGVYIGGLYGARADGVGSYAAGYPEPGDLFIARTLAVDAGTGEFLLSGGKPIVSEGGLLIRWDEIEYLELFEG